MWSRRRRIAVGTAGVAVGTVALLIALTALGPWAPILHWTCQPQGKVGEETTVAPGLLLNSPYGGDAWGNVTFPPGFLPDAGAGYGEQELNGGAAWAGYDATFTLSSLGNVTEWGPGSNDRCTEPYSVGMAPGADDFIGIPLLGPGNLSDEPEPTNLSGSDSLLSFENGFETANAPNVTTCGGPARSIPGVTSTELDLWVHFDLQSGGVTVPYDYPTIVSQFHYYFPANFGTWEVDNLSAPGGPGGGWAFAYAGPCS